MRNENPGNTLQPTALVHEVLLKLVDVENLNWQDRAHVYAVSANMMRRILVDHARAKGTAKKGGPVLRLNLDDAPEIASGTKDGELIAIDDALQAIGQFDARKAKVVELRFFGGLTIEETAEVLKISTQGVLRDWKMARAWLLAELAG